MVLNLLSVSYTHLDVYKRQIENLTKKFGGVVCANIPELSINKGELIGLVGNNGAGKTTLFRLVLDLLKSES